MVVEELGPAGRSERVRMNWFCASGIKRTHTSYTPPSTMIHTPSFSLVCEATCSLVNVCERGGRFEDVSRGQQSSLVTAHSPFVPLLVVDESKSDANTSRRSRRPHLGSAGFHTQARRASEQHQEHLRTLAKTPAIPQSNSRACTSSCDPATPPRPRSRFSHRLNRLDRCRDWLCYLAKCSGPRCGRGTVRRAGFDRTRPSHRSTRRQHRHQPPPSARQRPRRTGNGGHRAPTLSTRSG